MPPSIRTYLGMFVARSVAMLGPLGVAIVTARMLGPEDRGRYYYVITLAAVGAQLASLGIYASNSFLVSRQPQLLPRILANSVWIALVGGFLAAGGVLAFDLAAGEALHRRVLAAAVLLLCPGTLLFIYLSNLAVAVNRSRLFNGLVVFNSAAALIGTALAAYFAPVLDVFLAAAVAAVVLTCALAWLTIAQGQKVPWSFDKALFSQSLAFAARAHIAALVGFLMARTSVVILRHYEAFNELGHWSIAAQIADALLLLPATVGLLLFPSLVRAEPGDRWAEFTTMVVRIGLAMGVICLGTALVARPAIDLVFGVAYAPAASITLALLPGIFFLSITSVVSQFLSTFGIPLTQVAAWIVSWAVQILLSLFVLKHYGVLGLAWAQSACAGLACIWLSIVALEYSPKRVQLS